MTRIIRFKMRYARSKMRYAVLVKYLFEKNIHDVLMIFAPPSKTQHHAHHAAARSRMMRVMRVVKMMRS